MANRAPGAHGVEERSASLMGPGPTPPVTSSESRPALFRISRGDASGARFEDYKTSVDDGMVVLDAIHQIQAESAPDLACRWNCKAGKCGSCSAEINGKPRLMCMTRMTELDLSMPEV